MNAFAMAQKAYAAPQQPTRTARGTEYELFSRITHRMKSAQNLGTAGFPALVRALHENRQFWMLLAADVADRDNGLPSSLRAQIFYLAEFTQAHTRRVLSGDAAADALIDVNTSIMRGLRREGAR